MDWSLFHTINELGRHRDGLQDTAETYNAVALFALVAVSSAVWFAARPGGPLRSKLAALAAVSSAGLGLVLNSIAGAVWYHDRPFVDHPQQTLLLIHHAADNSFPSDHATVAFAVAFAVLVFHRRLGALLVLAAIGVAVDRVVVGVHYPVDVVASAFVAAASTSIVAFGGRRELTWAARQLSRLSDPLVAAARHARSRR
jgi:undecaprenyl-diphosphatase